MLIRSIDEDGLRTYNSSRPSTAGSVLFGGTYQSGNWGASIDLDAAGGIMKDYAKVASSLSDPHLTKVISHNVGLRPAREGGPRVEREYVDLPTASALLGPQRARTKEVTPRVVHAYGFVWTCPAFVSQMFLTNAMYVFQRRRVSEQLGGRPKCRTPSTRNMVNSISRRCVFQTNTVYAVHSRPPYVPFANASHGVHME